MLNRNQAAEMLDKAAERNPGPWREHSLHVARAAEAIARECGMDAEKAWVLGALHDIGRYEGVRAAHHLIAGFRMMTEMGEHEAARICMTHSFPDDDTENYIGEWDVTDGERAEIKAFVRGCSMDDYDRLIQLCDALCMSTGVCLIEKRLMDVALRYGNLPARVTDKWRRTMEIRADFERRMGRSVYELFPEAVANTFPARNGN